MTHRQHCKFYIASCEEDGGIYLCEYRDNEAFVIRKTPLCKPMYMTCHNGKLYVILRESFADKSSGIISYEIVNDELKNPSDIVSTKGLVACHLCVIEDNVYCVNYLSGNVIRLPDRVVFHSGKSIVPKRQDMPHTHYINSFDGKYLLCCDLGTDEIYTYDKNLSELARVSVPKGHGARHLTYKDGYAFCANELKSTVSMFEYSDGILKYMDTYDALPVGTDVESTIAAIRAKDNFVYVSNRGHDSISVFEIKDRKINLVQCVNCGGESPRDFNIFGNLLICANEKSDNVTFFEIRNGIPTKIKTELNIKSPLCVL